MRPHGAVSGPDRPFEVRLPGSKSYTNRALIIAASRRGDTRIVGGLRSDDTDRLARALDSFGGLSVEPLETGYLVRRSAEVLSAPKAPVDLGGGGTPARLLIAFATSAAGATVITGNKRLSERPMGDLVDALRAAGVDVQCLESEGRLPIRVAGGRISSRRWKVNGATSSQFTTALLLLAAIQEGHPIELEVAGELVSRPYVEMTLAMLGHCGVRVDPVDKSTFVVHPGRVCANEIYVEPDASAMSYFLGAAALTGTSIFVNGIGHGSAQGDVGLARILREMGCRVEAEARHILLCGARLTGATVDMDRMPDVVLTLAAIAPFALTKTCITGIGNLRVKECDRIAAAATELTRIGVRAEESRSSLTIHPGRPTKHARIHTYDDHRVAMAFAMLGLVHDGLEIEDPQCVRKSFPGFWDELGRFRDHWASAGAMSSGIPAAIA